MEKYGVSNEILYEDLRNEEAKLMQELQVIMSGIKTAGDRVFIENKLQQIRLKLTELDLKNS